MAIKSTKKDFLFISDNLQRAMSNGEEFIFIKKNIGFCEAFPLEKLINLFCDFGDSTMEFTGIPDELITRIDMSKYAPEATFNENSYIVYFSPPGCDTKEHVLSIISLFNMLSEKVIIYTSQEIYRYVKCFSNQNIEFCFFEPPGEVTISASLIITYGYCARKFIQQRIPTMIIGPYGFGRWVTPENISHLLTENFKGRPGGSFKEKIPLMLFIDEILEVKECKDFYSVLDENFKILENYLSKLNYLSWEDGLDKIESFYSNFKDLNKRDILKPLLATNVQLERNGDSILVQRKNLNDILFSIPETDVQLLKDLKGQLSCRELQQKYEMESEEFWDILQLLWERKAIVF